MKTTTNQSTPRPVNFATSQKSPKNGPYLLRYSKLSSSEEAVGQIPANGRTSLTEVGSSDIFYTDSFKPNDSMELQGWSRVYHDQPYLKDGKPVFDALFAHSGTSFEFEIEKSSTKTRNLGFGTPKTLPKPLQNPSEIEVPKNI